MMASSCSLSISKDTFIFILLVCFLLGVEEQIDIPLPSCLLPSFPYHPSMPILQILQNLLYKHHAQQRRPVRQNVQVLPQVIHTAGESQLGCFPLQYG
jgi:hypothetical protein